VNTVLLGVSLGGLATLKVALQALASILVTAVYAEKLGLVDVTGKVRELADRQTATPGGGGA
jgi:hypothetical protein